MTAYAMRRLALEEKKVEHLKHIADSLRHLEEFVGRGFRVNSVTGRGTTIEEFIVVPKRS